MSGAKVPQKPILRRGGLTGTWFVVTSYKDNGHGSIAASRKRELHADDAAQLDRWEEAADELALARTLLSGLMEAAGWVSGPPDDDELLGIAGSILTALRHGPAGGER